MKSLPMMDLNQVNCVLFLIVLVRTGGCQEEQAENPLQSYIQLDHLEAENTQRLKNVEEDLLQRTTTLLAINDRFNGLSETFKRTDPFIASLFNVPISGVHYSATLDEWMAHPIPSLRGSNSGASNNRPFLYYQLVISICFYYYCYLREEEE